MIGQLRNLIHYLHACYATLYPKGMGRGIQATDKTNELLSVITVCKNALHNDAMAHTCYKFMKILSAEYFNALISNLKTATWLLRF